MALSINLFLPGLEILKLIPKIYMKPRFVIILIKLKFLLSHNKPATPQIVLRNRIIYAFGNTIC